jgi:hypothetical protein
MGCLKSRLRHFADADGTEAKPSRAVMKKVIRWAGFMAFEVRKGKAETLGRDSVIR